MRLRLLAAVLFVAAAPVTAQVPADTLALPSRAAEESSLDPCGPADPLRGRLMGGSTACSLAPGEGHVSVRGAALVFFPVGAALQASMGAGRGVVLGVSTAGTLGGVRTMMGSLRVSLWHRSLLRVAAGGHVSRIGGSRYDTNTGSTTVTPYVVATIAPAAGATVTAQLTATGAILTPHSGGPRVRYGALYPSAGLTLATGRTARLVLEAGGFPSGSRGETLRGAPLTVGAAIRTFGRRGAFEIGIVTVPGELDACRDSDAYLCLPPVLPTVTFTRAFGRR